MHNLLPDPARAVTEPLTIGSHGQRALRFEEIVGDGHAAQDGVFYEVEAEWNMSGPGPASPLVFAKWGNISNNIVMRKENRFTGVESRKPLLLVLLLLCMHA